MSKYIFVIRHVTYENKHEISNENFDMCYTEEERAIEYMNRSAEVEVDENGGRITKQESDYVRVCNCKTNMVHEWFVDKLELAPRS